MVAAIGSSAGAAATAAIGAAKSPVGLEAERARVQKELSACVNCATAKTAKGQANIQALSSRLATITTQLEGATRARAVRPPEPTPADPVAPPRAPEAASAPRSASVASPAEAVAAVPAPGRRIDVFA